MELTFLEWTFYHNTLRTWLLAFLALSATFIMLAVAKRFIIPRVAILTRRTATDLDDLTVELLKRTQPLFDLILSAYVGSLALTLPPGITQLISTVVVMALFVQIGLWGQGFIAHRIAHYQRQKAELEAGSVMAIAALGWLGRLTLWSVLLLLALDNLGIEITALVAGLGIGGIAVGLAVQNILGDLFASLSIVLDKPFVIGDAIVVDDFVGMVEHVGLKTTRLRSLQGEQIIFANGDLLQSRIRNYKRMDERRILFSLGVTYETPYEKLAAMPEMLQEIIEAQGQTRFDRAHFKAYGDFSLNYEIVYYVLSADYKLYMDIQQAINLAIYRRFEAEGIEFAYPTQTLYLNGQLAGMFKQELDSTKVKEGRLSACT